jgi:hypothetical protein
MEKISRRKMLVLAGAGSAGVAVIAAVPIANTLATRSGNSFTFHAEAGLPAGGTVPAYCTWVIEGHLDLSQRSGTITTTMRAGYPELRSTTNWPGFGRIVRVSDVKTTAGSLQVKGAIADHAHLRQGESPTFNLLIDRARGVGHAWFFGQEVLLRLA